MGVSLLKMYYWEPYGYLLPCAVLCCAGAGAGVVYRHSRTDILAAGVPSRPEEESVPRPHLRGSYVWSVVLLRIRTIPDLSLHLVRIRTLGIVRIRTLGIVRIRTFSLHLVRLASYRRSRDWETDRLLNPYTLTLTPFPLHPYPYFLTLTPLPLPFTLYPYPLPFTLALYPFPLPFILYPLLFTLYPLPCALYPLPLPLPLPFTL